MATGDGFHIVNRRRGRRSNSNKQNVSGSATAPHKEDDESFDLKTFQRRLKDCMQELLLSDFFKVSYETIITALSALLKSKTKQNKTTSLEKVDDNFLMKVNGKSSAGLEGIEESSAHPVHLLCYGIGRFSTCPIARYQLGFLLAVKEKFKHPPCHVYDPVFTSQEKTTLEGLGCSLIDSNEEGKRALQGPTVAFLPHCGKALYNNVIWRNLSTPGHEGLHNLILVGNSFSYMVERTPERQLLKTANYVQKIQPYAKETPLPVHPAHTDVFNDMAIHTFPEENFKSLPAEFWADNPEPIYDEDDAELIMNKAVT